MMYVDQMKLELDKRIDKYTKMPYNMSYEDAHIRVLNEMHEQYGLEWSELL